MIKRLSLLLAFLTAIPAWSGTTNHQVPADELILNQITTPSNPASNHFKVYLKSGKLYYLDSTGTEKQINRFTDFDSTGCSSGQYPSADGSGGTTCQSPAVASNQSYEISNLGLSTSVSGNALTISLKQSDGSTAPTSGSPVKIGFRSSTSTSGLYNQRSVTAATSITIPSGTSIGTVNGVSAYLYVYVIDNAGTVEMAVSLSRAFDDGSVHSTTAVSGGTSASTIYSTTARTGVPVRLIGRVQISEATAGTWASSATEVALVPFKIEDSGTYTPTISNVANTTSQGAYVSNYMRVGNVVTVSGRVDVTTLSASGTASSISISLPFSTAFTVREDGVGNISGETGGGSASDQSGPCYANASSALMYCTWDQRDSAGTMGYYYHFTYRIK